MNKQELIDIVAANTDTNKKTVNAIITSVLEVITDTVADGDKVMLVGFGTFEPRDRSAREGRNPSTGEPMTIPAATVPVFSAGKTFKDAVADRSNTDVAA